MLLTGRLRHPPGPQVTLLRASAREPSLQQLPSARRDSRLLEVEYYFVCAIKRIKIVSISIFVFNPLLHPRMTDERETSVNLRQQQVIVVVGKLKKIFSWLKIF